MANLREQTGPGSSGDATEHSAPPAAVALALETQRATLGSSSGPIVPTASRPGGKKKCATGASEPGASVLPCRQYSRAARLQNFNEFVKHHCADLRAAAKKRASRDSESSSRQKASQKFVAILCQQKASQMPPAYRSWYGFLKRTAFTEAQEQHLQELHDWLILYR